MTFDECKAFLDGCVRLELADHAFGDMEITFTLNGVVVAEGYVGGKGKVTLSIWDPDDKEQAELCEVADEELVRELLKCGTLGGRERNDRAGPDNWVEGQVMPGLTLEGIRDEFTRLGL